MRIACVHIPQFALQCATRLDPSLRGAPVAVVSGTDPVTATHGGASRVRAAGVLHAPIVLACSRAAWSLGVRLGMTATAARGMSPELHVVTAEPMLERDAVRAIADSLLAVTGVVDLGGRVGAGAAHLAMYAEVPAKTRGSSFGDRLVELLGELGFTARIGIADDRFTAWVAAAYGAAATTHDNDEHGVVTVPRGGSAAFLAPRPLSLLAITPEVQHMLELLGVRTLGAFAALPAPSTSRPVDADYQALARGDSGAQLRPYAPDAPVREDIVVSATSILELEGSVGPMAAIALAARRIALRLAGRGRMAARLDVTAIPMSDAKPGPSEALEIPVSLDHAAASAEELARALRPVLESSATTSAPSIDGRWRLRVIVAGEAIAGEVSDSIEVFAEGSAPFARVAPSSAEATTSDSRSATAGSSSRGTSRTAARDSSARALSTSTNRATRTQRTLALGRDAANDEAQPETDIRPMTESDDMHGTINPLAVVLASTGSLFSLSAPGAHTERRDSHRRMRRGKQRRTRPTATVQPRLFDRISSK